MFDPIEMRPLNVPRRPARAARRRHWRGLLIGVALVVPLLGAGAYIAVYYAMYQLLPWQTSTGMAASILAKVHTPVAAAATRAVTTSDDLHVRRPAASHVAPAPITSPVLLHGQMQSGTISSTLLPGDHPYLIYLPPNYDATEDRYPVLYLLHGAPGQYTDWRAAAGIDQTLDALISVGRVPPMIVVLPDGNGGLWGDTEWANNADGSARAEDYLTHDVVPYVDQHFRTLTDRDHRAIGGLSTGGYGAVNLTLHHPDLFGYALSLSGNYVAGKTWNGNDIWGTDQAAHDLNNPMLYAPKATHTDQIHIYLAAGKGDNTDNSLQETQQFDALLNQLHVPHHTDYFDGTHTWDFWKTHIVDALDYLAQTMPH